jgi:putative zinc finger protein
MGSHDEFLELCAAAIAGELHDEEQARLDEHLAVCPECRRAGSEYEIAAIKGVATLAEDLDLKDQESVDRSWSVENAEEAFFKQLNRGQEADSANRAECYVVEKGKTGQRFTYRPSNIRWREVWMPFAAAVLLALALGIAAYRSGVNHGTDVAGTFPAPLKDPGGDAGYVRAQILAKLEENIRVIAGLRRQLSEQQKLVNGLKAAGATQARSTENTKDGSLTAIDPRTKHDEDLAAAWSKVAELQKAIDAASTQHDESAGHAAKLEAKVTELTQLVRDRGLALDQKEGEVAQQQVLLEHDRDIRELMGARDLYMAEIHDVSKVGTGKTYGRVFYTKGKSLIFYAYDLDAQPGVLNASTFQAWGRRGPDKQQALSLGIFYEDNLSKKRWVLKAADPKTLQDIDAVFVTVEPNGGSHHPSGKQLLFAYLRVSPNHP